MKITIQSTDKVIHLNGAPTRIWEGATENGLPIVCLVSELTGDFDGPYDEFERYPNKHTLASPAAERFALRMVPNLRLVKK